VEALAESALEFLARCEEDRTLEALVEDYSRLVAQFGVAHYIMAGLPHHGEDPESLIVVNKWPVEWLTRYREQAYFFHDPVTQFSFSQAKPFTWRAAREGSERTAIATRIEGEAAELRLVDGIGFPVAGPNQMQAVVSLATEAECDLPAPLRWLLMAASTACQVQALGKIRKHEPVRLRRLTPRERDVLEWIAHGKSQWDVSVILSVSEATVDMHLRHVREKLGAMNTAHAVAQAIHSGQIKI
jgi:LuxR family quorum sensing-dependent transcriptional regulator